MNILHAGILGVIEGLTEFLPVSSTFHLIWFSKLLGITQNDFTKLFEVVIQSGAILAVVILYYKTVIHDRILMKKVLMSFLPTAIVGFMLYKVIKSIFFENAVLQLAVFIAVGLIFVVLEFFWRNRSLYREAKTLTYKEAVIVGLAQSLAVIPGVSRAGAVILSLMMVGVKRDEAARFSFLLALPTILAASFFDLFKMRRVLWGQTSSALIILAGFIAAFISALFIMKWFISYLEKNSLSRFGWYRILAGLFLMTYQFLRIG